MPVVDKDNRVVGIMTEYNLITKNTQLHLPTFLKLMEQFDLYKKDKNLIAGDLKKILALKVSDVMNKDPLTLTQTASLDEASRAFAEHKAVNPIPIVDDGGKLVGVMSRYDLLGFYGGSKTFGMLTDADRPLDRDVDKFLDSFEKEFILVTKFRTHYWFFISILFAIVGFLIAMAFILDVGQR